MFDVAKLYPFLSFFYAVGHVKTWYKSDLKAEALKEAFVEKITESGLLILTLHTRMSGFSTQKDIKKDTPAKGVLLGGPTWARTRDFLIMSQIL